jgi:hypothetical protein
MAKIQSAGSVAGKETIYVDVDDEITAIIDKVSSAKGKVVALVLPKRASVLQSIVNMKLLKRTAEGADKNLVLITSEAGLLPLAGAVGLHVASTPTSRPAIPAAPAPVSDEPEDVDQPLDIVDGNSTDDFDAKAAASTSIGALASAGAAAADAEESVDDTIDMSDDAVEETAAPLAAKAAKVKKDRKLMVPNFDSFRNKLLLVGLAVVVLIAGLVFALTALPSAKITIHTDSSSVATNLTMTLDTATKKLDLANKIVPATSLSQQKTATQQVAATGQQNNGEKASGSITITNCSGSNVTFPAGTSFSSSGHTFTSDNSVTVPDSNYTSPVTGSKCKNDGKATVNVTALKGGADYNLASSQYSISGNPGSVTAQGSQMSGGTDNITKIVTQSDIDGATNKIKSDASTTVSDKLTSDLQAKGLLALPTTFAPGTPQVTTSAKAGDAADTVTVTAVTSYTMLGVQKSDVRSLIVDNVNNHIDKSKQVILDDGVSSAKFTEQSPATATGASVSLSAKSVAGPDINTTALKTQLAGKKSGDIKSQLRAIPGVTEVDVKFSPFWVNSVPKKAAKVQVVTVKSGN